MSIDAIQFLRNLVEIPSLSGQERPIADYLVGRMREWGFDQAFIDPAGNAVGMRTHGTPRREIILLGHMDTVPGSIPVRIENGELFGRGAVDAKGPLAAFVVAAALVDLLPGTRLIVIGATEEESATSRGARYAAGQYSPDFCIIGEPSGWNGLTLGYKGRLLLDYELVQEMGHSAGPGISPAEAAVTFWNGLSEYSARHNADHPRLFDQLLPSIRHFETASDGLLDIVKLNIGLRLPPNFAIDALIDLAQELRGEAEIEFRGYEPAFQTGRSNALYRAFSVAIRGLGETPIPKLKTGTADMNVVGPIWQCPIIAYGPGDSTLDHTPRERISLDEYQQAILVLQQVLTSISRISN